jgi:hypothetical protein
MRALNTEGSNTMPLKPTMFLVNTRQIICNDVLSSWPVGYLAQSFPGTKTVCHSLAYYNTKLSQQIKAMKCSRVISRVNVRLHSGTSYYVSMIRDDIDPETQVFYGTLRRLIARENFIDYVMLLLGWDKTKTLWNWSSNGPFAHSPHDTRVNMKQRWDTDRGKHKDSEKSLLNYCVHHRFHTGVNSGLGGEKPSTNYLSYGTTSLPDYKNLSYKTVCLKIPTNLHMSVSLQLI